MWWLKAQFLSDLFEKLNSLNLSLQGPSENIITATSKLKSFDEKLKLWSGKISKGIFDFFPSVNESQLKKKIVPEIMNTLKNLHSAFKHYFPSLDTDDYGWVLNPFGSNENPSLTTEEEKQLIDLRNDKLHQSTFHVKNLDEFRISVRKEFPSLSLRAIKIILPFPSSWLCEFGFSALTEIKCKKRKRLLTIDEEMRVCLSTLEPRFNLICSQKQAHPSH